jgi:hypothetical protein
MAAIAPLMCWDVLLDTDAIISFNQPGAAQGCYRYIDSLTGRTWLVWS